MVSHEHPLPFQGNINQFFEIERNSSVIQCTPRNRLRNDLPFPFSLSKSRRNLSISRRKKGLHFILIGSFQKLKFPHHNSETVFVSLREFTETTARMRSHLVHFKLHAKAVVVQYTQIWLFAYYYIIVICITNEFIHKNRLCFPI